MLLSNNSALISSSKNSLIQLILLLRETLSLQHYQFNQIKSSIRTKSTHRQLCFYQQIHQILEILMINIATIELVQEERLLIQP